MKVFRTVATIILLAWPLHALAQDHVPKAGEEDKPKSSSEIAAERAAERSYKRSLSNIPDQAPADPWGNARAAEASKDHSKASVQANPAKPRTKTGSVANTSGSAN